MSYVEAATADPAAARARLTASDGGKALSDPASAGPDFASVFSIVRSSNWLDDLMRRQGEVLGDRAKLQRRGKETPKAANRTDRSVGPQDANRRERTEEAGRSDRSQRSRAGERAKTERPAEPDRQTQTKSSEPSSERRTVEARGVDGRQEIAPERTTTEWRPASAETAAETPVETDACPSESEAAATVQLIPAAQLFAPPLGQIAATAGEATTTATNAGTVELPLAVPVSVPAAPAGSMVVTSEAVVMPAGPTTGDGGGQDAGARQDAAATPGTSKSSEVAPRQTGTGSPFSLFLEQVGRQRLAAAVRPAAGDAKPVVDDSVKLTRSEGIEQLVRVVRSSLGGRHSSMTLRLDPPDLGQLKVDVRMNEHNLVVRFQTETRAAHDLLEHRLSELRQALEQHGVRLDRAEVELRPPAQPGQTGRESDGQPGRHDTSHGGEPGSGQPRSHQEGPRESEGTRGASNHPVEGPPPTSDLDEPRSGEGGAPAEPGVDLVV